MAKISASTLEQIRLISIEKVIEPHVELHSKGRDLWGCCPFHNEKTPSFKVDAEKGFFKCFGCDAKGDAITFIMKKLGFSYNDAIVYLAERYGINMEYEGSDFVQSKDIAALHDDIQIMARKNFYSETGQDARAYIAGRDFDDEDFESFGIGWLPYGADYSNIIKKFSKDILYNSGFFKESKYGAPFSRFFNRLVLPIRNITGSIAAFAGRSLDGSNPKYLNSAESSLFHKRESLFNMDKAKDAMINNRKSIIVEGYFDVMRLYKSGFRNAVAPMGTALTAEQINLLKRYSDEITVIFDGDEAGGKAAARSLEKFAECGMFPKVVFLPKDEDPDSFILKKGAAAFNDMFEKREDLFINRAKKAAASAGNDFNLKLARFKAFKNMLAKVENIHLRDHYIEIAADIFKLKKENIEEEIAESRYKRAAANKIKKNKNIYVCEKNFIACLSRLPMDVAESLICDIKEEMINDEEIGKILKKILEFSSDIMDIRQIANELGDTFMELAMRDINGDAYVEAVENKRRIELNYLKKCQNDLIEKMRFNSDGTEKLNMLKELDALTKQIVSKSINSGSN